MGGITARVVDRGGGVGEAWVRWMGAGCEVETLALPGGGPMRDEVGEEITHPSVVVQVQAREHGDFRVASSPCLCRGVCIKDLTSGDGGVSVGDDISRHRPPHLTRSLV